MARGAATLQAAYTFTVALFGAWLALLWQILPDHRPLCAGAGTVLRLAVPIRETIYRLLPTMILHVILGDPRNCLRWFQADACLLGHALWQDYSMSISCDLIMRSSSVLAMILPSRLAKMRYPITC